MPLMPWLLFACTVQVDVGDLCASVVINEVMTASDNYQIPDEDSTSDWFELRNTGASMADLGGHRLVGHTNDDSAFTLPEGFHIPDPGGIALFIAGTYEDPDSPTPIVGFDFNGDGDSLELRAGDLDAEIECDSVFIPDQHHGFSWQRDPEADADSASPWCDSQEPTPGAVNTECLCEGTDAC